MNDYLIHLNLIVAAPESHIAVLNNIFWCVKLQLATTRNQMLPQLVLLLSSSKHLHLAGDTE